MTITYFLSPSGTQDNADRGWVTDIGYMASAVHRNGCLSESVWIVPGTVSPAED